MCDLALTDKPVSPGVGVTSRVEFYRALASEAHKALAVALYLANCALNTQ